LLDNRLISLAVLSSKSRSSSSLLIFFSDRSIIKLQVRLFLVVTSADEAPSASWLDYIPLPGGFCSISGPESEIRFFFFTGERMKSILV
jgi:hypothetical protein